MKKAAKALVVLILGWQIRRLRKKHAFKIVAVAGSIGKTSTKLAIARVLSQSLRVRYQEGNYNDIVSVPLIFFGQTMPSLNNPLAWLKVFLNNQLQIGRTYPYDVVVIELGTDGPGQIPLFKKYITADISVVTALTPEHMMFFSGMQAVVDEEMSVAQFSKQILVNTDMCANEYLQSISGSYLSYGMHDKALYKISDVSFTEDGSRFKISKNGEVWTRASHWSFSEPQLYSVLAATAVGDMLGVGKEAIVKGFERIMPVAGRMQRLEGKNGSVIIDDTYNSSPDAVKAAIATLYHIKAPHKIALLGNMNELGTYSAAAHEEIGKLCDPDRLDLVVTLGSDANKYLAAAAEKNGCKVVRTDSPNEAGDQIAQLLGKETLVLAKGSQNQVYAEEALKALLLNPSEESKLVRQSSTWMKVKRRQFKT